jgi:hypothetical protein
MTCCLLFAFVFIQKKNFLNSLHGLRPFGHLPNASLQTLTRILLSPNALLPTLTRSFLSPAKDDFCCSLLYLACYYDRMPIVRWLLEVCVFAVLPRVFVPRVFVLCLHFFGCRIRKNFFFLQWTFLSIQPSLIVRLLLLLPWERDVEAFLCNACLMLCSALHFFPLHCTAHTVHSTTVHCTPPTTLGCCTPLALH